MKDKSTIIILDIVLIVIAIALAIFLVVVNADKKQDSINFATEEISTQIDDSLMKEYSSDKLGVKLKYYNEFEKVSEVTENSMYTNAGMFRNGGNDGVNILIGNLSKDISFEEYMYSNIDAVISTNNLKNEDITVIKNNVKMGGIEAYKIRYKIDGVNIYQMATIKEGKEYIFTYSAEDIYYDKQRAENMFSTFEFI